VTRVPGPDPPKPVGDTDSQPFWDACLQQRLVGQRCAACGRFRWPPRGVCPACGSWRFEWLDLPGEGVVQAFAVPHRAFNPAFAERVPYVIVHVALEGTDGRVVLISNLEGCDWQAVRVGMAVRVAWGADGLPKFRRV
jgi:uncharacterized OB-fold protein